MKWVFEDLRLYLVLLNDHMEEVSDRKLATSGKVTLKPWSKATKVAVVTNDLTVAVDVLPETVWETDELELRFWNFSPA